MQRDLSYAQAIGNRAARQTAAAARAAGAGATAAAAAAAAGSGQPGAAAGTSTAAGEGAADRSGPADVPKLTFTIDGHHLSPTTTIFQAVQVARCLVAVRWIVWNLLMRILAVVIAPFT